MPIRDGAIRDIMMDLSAAMEVAADTAAGELRTAISAGARSGEHWPGLPRQSSSQTEFPQEQSGDLKRSVGIEEQLDDRRLEAGWNVGFFDVDQSKLDDLEIREWKGNRAPLRRIVGREYTATLMADAIEQEVGL